MTEIRALTPHFQQEKRLALVYRKKICLFAVWVYTAPEVGSEEEEAISALRVAGKIPTGRPYKIKIFDGRMTRMFVLEVDEEGNFKRV